MEDKFVFVSVGYPEREVPIAILTLVVILPGETEAQKAKMLRKTIASEQNVRPSELYWAIYDKGNYDAPRLYSENAPMILFETNAKDVALAN